MRNFIIAGNWKMNLGRAEAVDLAAAVAAAADSFGSTDVVLCPPSCYLDCVVQSVGESDVGVGAQNAYAEKKGAFTGELSPVMLRDLGADYVILGHSERRNLFGESDELVNRKLHAALAEGLKPIVCVGELLEQRESGRTAAVIEQQFRGSLAGLDHDQMRTVVIAYEPVWAIGTGKVASPEQAEEVHQQIRSLLQQHFDAAVADEVRIQYGGSVSPANAAELLAQPNVDGALVGGASLKSDSFLAIVAATANE